MEAARREMDDGKRLELYRQISPAARGGSAGGLPLGRGPVLGRLQADRPASRSRRSVSSTSCPARSAGGRPPRRDKARDDGGAARRASSSSTCRGCSRAPSARCCSGTWARASSRSSIPRRGTSPAAGARRTIRRAVSPAYYLSINRNKESSPWISRLRKAPSRCASSPRAPTCSSRTFRREASRSSVCPSRSCGGDNPRLVTASITGFGRRGPGRVGSRLRPARAGGSGAHGDHRDARERPDEGRRRRLGPLRGLLRGRRHRRRPSAGRERTGAGGHVETDLFSSTLASLINVAQSALVTGEEAKPHGNAHAQIVPYRTFSASDGDFAWRRARTGSSRGWPGCVGRPEWAQDPRYRTNAARVANRARLEAALEEIFRREPRDAWLSRLPGSGSAGGSRARAARSAAVGDGPRARRRPRLARRLLRRLADPRRRARRRRSISRPALDADGERLRREFGLPGAPRPREA